MIKITLLNPILNFESRKRYKYSANDKQYKISRASGNAISNDARHHSWNMEKFSWKQTLPIRYGNYELPITKISLTTGY